MYIISRIKYFLVFVVGFLLIQSISFSQSGGDFPERPNPPKLVNDFAGVLRLNEIEELERRLVAYNDSTSTEVAIVTMKSTGNYDIAEYSFALGDKWGIGKEKKDNGVLILAAIDDRKFWIATGRGMEGVLPDALVGRIFRNEVAPEFKQGNYYRGLSNAVWAIEKAAAGEYQADPQQEEGVSIGTVIFILILMVIIIFIISRNGGRGGGGRYISRRGTDIFFGPIGGGWSSGGGGSDWGGGSSGGGFGGFGGGSFGGGGAGGSW